ncbi:MAG: methyltransferase domain-containing protein [Gammaproteobacteria bacterium]|nr:methyltransferase domain-containing protein [Gammaproteobacteria bacterium]
MQTATYDKALGFFNQGNYKKAKRIVDQVIKTDRSHADAYFLKGQMVYSEDHDLDRAEKLIDKALSLNPNVAEYYLYKGIIHSEKKNIDEAAINLQRSLDLSPDDYRAQALLADMYRLQCKYKAAYSLYKAAQTSAQLLPISYFYIMYCLQESSLLVDSSIIEEDVIKFLQQPSLEHNRFSKYICQLIKAKYKLDNPETEVGINELARDDLFLKLLQQIYICDTDIENLVINIRRSLMVYCLEHSVLPNDWLELVISVARQCFNNEYVFQIGEDEMEMILGLEELLELLLKQEDVSIAQNYCVVLVLAMYQLPYNSRSAKLLLNYPLQEWPAISRELIKLTLLEIADEIRRAATIRQLTVINDSMSQSVRAQYETNPYPRWLRITHGEHHYSLKEHIRMECTSSNELPSFMDGKVVNVLIAGCGSGKQVMQLAKVFTETNVLAVDLSRRSLAYAQRMAEIYDVRNVRLLQADILELGQLNEQFHIIYCNGVLHHMEDPLQGWQILRQLLHPDGLMNIGLYSEIARQSITKVRNFIQANEIQPTPENIRDLRQGIIANRCKDPVARDICELTDFYSMSSCRDLLFHVQEHRLTLPRLQQMLPSLNLNFLGFQLPERRHFINYKRLFPEDADMIDLNHWSDYERQHPYTFGSMYQFWCRAIK